MLPKSVGRVAALMLLVFLIAVANAQPSSVARPRGLVIGHRGASRLGPENTLYSIQQSIEAGADAIEIDLRESKDGEIILLHDATLDRTTDGTGPAVGMTLAELQALDARIPGNARFAEIEAQTVPTLAEALETINGHAMVVLDIKERGLEERIAGIVRNQGMGADVIACCWTPDVAEAMRAALPECAVCHLGSAPKELTPDFFGEQSARGVRCLSIAYKSATAEFLRAAHLRGFTVYVWTINDPAVAQELITRGADGIITDDPVGILSALSAAK